MRCWCRCRSRLLVAFNVNKKHSQDIERCSAWRLNFSDYFGKLINIILFTIPGRKRNFLMRKRYVILAHIRGGCNVRTSYPIMVVNTPRKNGASISLALGLLSLLHKGICPSQLSQLPVPLVSGHRSVATGRVMRCKPPWLLTPSRRRFIIFHRLTPLPVIWYGCDRSKCFRSIFPHSDLGGGGHCLDARKNATNAK